MLTEKGRVVAIEGDTVWVETLRQSTCGSCTARSGCGHGMLNGAMPGASRGLVKTRLSADAGLDLKIHDEVEISIPEGGFLRAAALLYAVPMMATLAAALLTDHFLVSEVASQSSTDLQVTAAAAAGLAAGLLLVRYYSRRADSRADNDDGFRPHISGKV